MGMFCYQCQESAGNTGCTVKGVCGKDEETSNLQDLLIYQLKGISYLAGIAGENGVDHDQADHFVMDHLFTTITNTNFDADKVQEIITRGFGVRDHLMQVLTSKDLIDKESEDLPDAVTWGGGTDGRSRESLLEKAVQVGIRTADNEDIRSLQQLVVIGLKGMAAYAHHASVLGYEDKEIFTFMHRALAATLEESPAVDDLISLVMETGKVAVTTLALLDRANTEKFGIPEPTQVNIGTRDRPGILVSGHDLRDLEELLEQTRGSGVDVYTHGEMLPAHAYPAFKQFDNLVGNYGNSWWMQPSEFEKFNGPIVMTTNCLVTPKPTYQDRVFTTNIVAYPGLNHIPDRNEDGMGTKDFTQVIDLAKQTKPPVAIESGTIPIGFAHDTILSVADIVIGAVKSGAIKRFFVMAGCDGRMKDRTYFEDVAKSIPEDTVILTAGCAKYRYNKLCLGEIGGIPRVIDAGQCNDSYSLAVVALKLAEAFGVDSINDLPISFDIAWYEQKAVTVLLALLHLGVKGIRLGPTLPAFLSPNVVKVLVENFDIKPTGSVEEDIRNMMDGN